MSLPKNFELVKEEYSTFAANWVIIYSPINEKLVEIGLIYDGKPLYIDDAEFFRSIINKQAQVLFLNQPDGTFFEQEKDLVSKLTFIMGKTGNNQVTNQRVGLNGPEFYLERLETLLVNGRRALSVKGYFQSPEESVQNHYYGLLFERKRNSKECDMEEIYFQAHTQELYDKYFFDFTTSLKSIIWV